MSDVPTPSPAYALGRLMRAIETLQQHPDPETRERAAGKVGRWTAVIEGMCDGTLRIGSRTPVADTPAWVTLEVVTGGFATGSYLAEAPVSDDEQVVLDGLPADLVGETAREQLNQWYLSDAGLGELRDALESGRYRVDLPEEGALLVVCWLLDNSRDAEALELVAILRPLMHRLRFSPRFEADARPVGAVVRLESVQQVAARLRDVDTSDAVRAMNDALRVWNPLLDRLVALWCDTVDGELPRLVDDAIVGGWPCRRWPDDWAVRRAAWLEEFRAAVRDAIPGRHTDAKSNLTRMREALERCPDDSVALDGRAVGWIRRGLANAITRRGEAGSERLAALRAVQAYIAARPENAVVAGVVVDRFSRYPGDGGIPSIDPIAAEVAEGESDAVPAGHPIPRHIVDKAARALEAPIDELVDRGIIGSAEVLAQVLPQITSQVAAAGIDDPVLRDLFGRVYAAFRRRRSLLLLNLEHQVQLDELPWVAAIDALRSRSREAQSIARQTLEQATLLALGAFPQRVLPNPLVRELGALAGRAGLRLPLVEEVAADIFMGTFTLKWREAAQVASALLRGTLYARYYDLPDAWADKPRRRWRTAPRTAKAFAAMCRARSVEAGRSRGWSVAANGVVLEQSQILTTQNLAVLVDALDLGARIAGIGADLAWRALDWVVGRQTMKVEDRRARMQMTKNTAYAWRQAIFFLGFCDVAAQREVGDRLAERIAGEDPLWQARLAPAVTGLRAVIDGVRFDASGRLPDGRRFLGWSVGPHWTLAE